MTDEQVQKLFDLVGTSISETREVRKIVDEHTAILNEHTAILNEHTAILKEHSALHKDHKEKLDLLINRTSDIANTVMTNDKRLTQVEKDITEIRGGVH
jgi:hypothetical protein